LQLGKGKDNRKGKGLELWEWQRAEKDEQPTTLDLVSCSSSWKRESRESPRTEDGDEGRRTPLQLSQLEFSNRSGLATQQKPAHTLGEMHCQKRDFIVYES